MLSARVKIAFLHGKHSPDRAQPPEPGSTQGSAEDPTSSGEGHDRALSQPEAKEKGLIAAVMQPLRPQVLEVTVTESQDIPSRKEPTGSPSAASPQPAPELRVGFRDSGWPGAAQLLPTQVSVRALGQL